MPSGILRPFSGGLTIYEYHHQKLSGLRRSPCFPNVSKSQREQAQMKEGDSLCRSHQEGAVFARRGPRTII